MTLIENANQWKWYLKRLDVEKEYEHRHIGEPERFPCKVDSVWGDDADGPNYFKHTFIYQQVIKCEKCGHVFTEWPKE